MRFKSVSVALDKVCGMGGRELMPLLVLLTLSHVSYRVSGCHSRSGEDTERVYSHQGTEPSFEKEAEAVQDNTVDTGATDQDDDSKIRETGEIKVCDILLTSIIHTSYVK